MLAGYNSVSYFDALSSHLIAVSAARAGLAKVEADTGWFGVLSGDLPEFSGSYVMTRDSLEPLLMRCVSSYTTSTSDVIQDTVEVYFDDISRHPFTLLSWMTGDEGNVQWISGDTVFGKLHTNGVFRVNGAPVFTDRVTTTNGFLPAPGTGTNRGIYMKGWQMADSIQFPTDLLTMYNKAIDTTGNGHYFDLPDLWVSLYGGNPGVAGDGWALVNSSPSGLWVDSIPIQGTGNLIMGSGNVHVRGTLDGALTVGSFGSIYIEDNVLYERDPRRVQGSTDVMGLVAEDSVIITDNTANSDGITVNASVIARDGSFMAQDFNTGPVRGRVSLLGSIVQAVRGPMGTNLNGVPYSGYMKSHTYDQRLSDPDFRPPAYPGWRPRTLPIIGWWESIRMTDFSKYSL